MAEITTRYSKLSDTEFYQLFTTAKWSRMDVDARLDAAQEVEIRAAARQGRPAIPVKPDDPAKKGAINGSILYGSFRPSSVDITLNYGFLDWDLQMNAVGLSPSKMLETILHEGRHALQHMCINQMIPLPDGISENTLRQWFASDYAYMRSKDAGFPYYQAQSIERDARRFAALEFKRIYRNIFRATGQHIPEFEKKIRKTYDMEDSHLDDVLDLTEDDLRVLKDKADKIFLNFYKHNPDVRRFMDLRGLSLEDVSRLITVGLDEIRNNTLAVRNSLDDWLLTPDDLDIFSDLDVEEEALKAKLARVKPRIDRNVKDVSRTESVLAFRG